MMPSPAAIRPATPTVTSATAALGSTEMLTLIAHV